MAHADLHVRLWFWGANVLTHVRAPIPDVHYTLHTLGVPEGVVHTLQY